MALKVGMRVKKVANCSGRNDIPLGAQGTIVGVTSFPPAPQGMNWLLLWDGISKDATDIYNAADFMLAPLTDPSADEWADAQIAKLKKLEPHPVREVA